MPQFCATSNAEPFLKQKSKKGWKVKVKYVYFNEINVVAMKMRSLEAFNSDLCYVVALWTDLLKKFDFCQCCMCTYSTTQEIGL